MVIGDGQKMPAAFSAKFLILSKEWAIHGIDVLEKAMKKLFQMKS
jgi:hypothetical protein